MEIVHLILGKANPERMNGVNKVVYQLATKQAESGRKVSVFGVTKDLAHNYGPRNFETCLFRAYANPFKMDQGLKDAILAKKGNAVFHFHGGWVPFYATVSAFLSKHHIPFVITAHGAYNTIAMQRSRWMKKVYFHAFEKPMLKRASRIHSLGESEIEGLNKMYPNNKSFRLPYGFDAIQNNAVATKNENDFIVGFVGRLDIYTKGLDIVIEGFEKFLQLYPEAKLWIIGDGKEKVKLERMIKELNLQDKVVLFGSKFGEEKNNLIAAMDVFVHPSRNEGLPVAVLEACSMQIPAIVSKATNIGTYIKKYHAGISIPDNSVESLKFALVNLYSLWIKKDLGKTKENALRMVQESFSWNHITNEFDNLYVS